MTFRSDDDGKEHNCDLCRDVSVINLVAVASNVVICERAFPDDPGRLARKIEDLRRAILSLGPMLKLHHEALGHGPHEESPYITGALPAKPR